MDVRLLVAGPSLATRISRRRERSKNAMAPAFSPLRPRRSGPLKTVQKTSNFSKPGFSANPPCKALIQKAKIGGSV